MEKTESNPTPPRVLVTPTDDGARVPSPVANFQRTPVIEPMVTSLQAFIQRCRQKEDEAHSGTVDIENDDFKKNVEDIMSLFCCLISTS